MHIFAGSDIVSFIGQVLTLVGVLVVGRWAYKAKQDSKETLHQVANDHETNLRDDLTRVIEKVDVLDKKMDDQTTETRLLREGWQVNRDDIDAIMNTEQRHRLRERLEWGQPSLRREWRERNGYGSDPHKA